MQPAISIENGSLGPARAGPEIRDEGPITQGSKTWIDSSHTDASRVPDQEAKASSSTLGGAGPSKTRRLQSQERVASWFARGDSLESGAELPDIEGAHVADTGRGTRAISVPVTVLKLRRLHAVQQFTLHAPAVTDM